MNDRRALQIAVKLRLPLRELAEAAARRQLGTALAATDQEADAIATDDLATAVEAANERRSVLLFDARPQAISEAGAACERAGTTFMPAHPWRFRPSNLAAVQSLLDGELGSPGLVRIHRWDPNSINEMTVEAILPEIDLIHWVFGASHLAVHAVRRGQEYLQVHFGFPGGGMAIADFAFGFPGSYRSFSIIGSRGAAYADDHRNMNLFFTPGSAQAIRTGQGDMHLLAIFREFTGSVREGRVPLVTAADAKRSADAAQLVLDLAGKGSRA